MRNIRSCKELYYEIIKSFYLGEYKLNDKFMTHIEAQAYYNMSKSSVEKTYRMLVADDFLHTDGVHGSKITFDVSNPLHANKAPFFRPDPNVKDFNTFELPSLILSSVLTRGLKAASASQLSDFLVIIDKLLFNLHNGASYYFL